MDSDPSKDLRQRLEQWSETAHQDVDAMEFFILLARFTQRAHQSLTHVHQRHGLGEGDFDVMATLARQDQGMSPTTLSRELLVSKSGLTGRLKRLEQKGYVSRSLHQLDGRGFIIRLTAEGARVLHEAFPHHIRTEHELLSPLSSEQQQRLLDLFRALTSDELS